MMNLRRSMLAAPLLGVMAAAGAAAPPQETGTLRPGEITERVSCAGDPSQTYALSLPAGYSRDRAWPLLVLMDPRGRALVPLRLFQAAAAKHGYLLASSYDTLSDGPAEPNGKAIAAMLPDLQGRLAVDTRRLYLAGFSGTARAAWDLAYRLKGHVAGVIGIGGGLPPGLEPASDTSFAFFGGAGTLDFNYEEMRSLDAKLAGMRLPHRFRSFEGPHAWPPESICEEAIEFLELRAMTSEARSLNRGMLEDLLERRLAQAREVETSGDLLGARERYRDAASDFAPLPGAGRALEEAQRLEGSKGFSKSADRERRLMSRRQAYERRFTAFLGGFAASPPPSLTQSLAALQIERLDKEARRQDDPMGALAARRLLELVFVHTSFYEPREFLSLSDPTRARALLLIAGAIKPKHPSVCLNLARAEAQLGRKSDALDALGCAVDGGVGDPDALAADGYLAPLRDETRFREILDGLRARHAP